MLTRQASKWKRMYMSSEHDKRNWVVAWRRREFSLLRTISEIKETVELLHSELCRSKNEVRSQIRAIKRMHDIFDAHSIPVFPAMMSFRLCTSVEGESCPLALESIDSCAGPFENCCTVLDPLKPNEKCAELGCGHRFNAVWLMFHFVRNSTFRCPVCRKGRKRFSFDMDTIPQCMSREIYRLKEDNAPIHIP